MLILLSGISGSGKTTVATGVVQRLVGSEVTAKAVSADDFWGEDYKFDISRISEAHAWCMMETVRSLKAYDVVLVHNVFANLRDVAPYRAIAAAMNLPILEIRLDNSIEGAKRNVHNVPEQAIKVQFENWWKDKDLIFSTASIPPVTFLEKDSRNRIIDYIIRWIKWS